MIYGRRSEKLYLSFLQFLQSIRENKKSIIISPDYIVLSRPAYDALIEQHQKSVFEARYDEPIMEDWILQLFRKEK